jgi:hypothetical protein
VRHLIEFIRERERREREEGERGGRERREREEGDSESEGERGRRKEREHTAKIVAYEKRMSSIARREGSDGVGGHSECSDHISLKIHLIHAFLQKLKKEGGERRGCETY